MNNGKIKEKIKSCVLRYAKRRKWFRFCVVVVLAVCLFFAHLFKGRRLEWRASLAIAVSIVLVAILLVPVELESTYLLHYVERNQHFAGETFTESNKSSFLQAPGKEKLVSGELIKERTEKVSKVLDDIELKAEVDDSEKQIQATDEVTEADSMSIQEINIGIEANGIQIEDGTVFEEVQNFEADNGISDGDIIKENEMYFFTVSGADQTVSDNNIKNSGLPNENITVSGNGVSHEDTVSGSDAEEPETVGELRLEVLSRNGGYFVEGVFFGSTGAWYEVTVSGNQSVSDGDAGRNLNEVLFYRIAEQEYQTELKNGAAILEIPDSVQGPITIWCNSCPNKISEYIVIEHTAPEIAAEVIQDDLDVSFVQVDIVETGDVISGIQEYNFIMDGEPLEVASDQERYTYLNTGLETEIATGLSIMVPLNDLKEHKLAVNTVDLAGNISEETFSVKAKPQGVISVVLPTSFDILMYPDVEGDPGIIESNDIIVCNKSVFPVDIVVRTARVHVVSSGDAQNFEKECILNLELLEAEKDIQRVALPEGETSDIMSFRLDVQRPETDAVELLDIAAENQHLKQIFSADYAALRLRGNMSEADWRDGDLKVQIVFDIKRSEEIGTDQDPIK